MSLSDAAKASVRSKPKIWRELRARLLEELQGVPDQRRTVIVAPSLIGSTFDGTKTGRVRHGRSLSIKLNTTVRKDSLFVRAE